MNHPRHDILMLILAERIAADHHHIGIGKQILAMAAMRSVGATTHHGILGANTTGLPFELLAEKDDEVG